jgi:hypothetical protein
MILGSDGMVMMKELFSTLKLLYLDVFRIVFPETMRA